MRRKSVAIELDKFIALSLQQVLSGIRAICSFARFNYAGRVSFMTSSFLST